MCRATYVNRVQRTVVQQGEVLAKLKVLPHYYDCSARMFIDFTNNKERISEK